MEVYKSFSSMSSLTYVVEWVGGYSSEVVQPGYINEFFKEKGLVLKKSKTVGRKLGNNELFFRII